MSVGVLTGFETVHVDQQHAHGLLQSNGTLPFHFKLIFKIGVVGNGKQTLGMSGHFKLAVGQYQFRIRVFQHPCSLQHTALQLLIVRAELYIESRQHLVNVAHGLDHRFHTLFFGMNFKRVSFCGGFISRHPADLARHHLINAQHIQASQSSGRIRPASGRCGEPVPHPCSLDQQATRSIG